MKATFIRSILATTLAFVAASAAAAQDSELPRDSEQAPAKDLTVIVCGTLLAEPGEPPQQNMLISIRGGRIDTITAIEEGLDVAAAIDALREEMGTDRVIDLSDSWVLPGLIDCHTHITMEYTRDVRLRRVEETDADNAIDGVAFARRTLEAGFTTIRNVGSSGDSAFALRDAVEAGKVPGPRILVAGESISPTGGHSDGTHGYREDLWNLPGAMEGIADGTAECRKSVRAQVKRGADLIKLTATGGVLSATAAGTDQQFYDDELEAIIETAHMLGRKVAAHAHGADGIKAALRAGVDSIEHGTFIDDEAISLFKERGAYLVPTILAGVWVAEMAEDEGYYPPMVAAKARAVGPQIQGAFGRAYEGGVKIAFGTDSGVSPHGMNAREFELMVEAGMPAAEAIRSATINAAELCGLADDIGAIRTGMQADIIAVNGDPLADISVLRDVRFVMRRGVVHKQ